MPDTFTTIPKFSDGPGTAPISAGGAGGTSQSTADSRYLQITNNLSDLANAATALTNLGLTATAAELNKLDGTNSIVQGNLGLKDGTAALDLSSLSVTNALSASTLRTDTGKFLSPFSYQFRNAGDTGFRDVQMAALTATGATITGDVSINTGTTSLLTLKGTDIGAPGIVLTDETEGTEWKLVKRGTQSDDLQVLYDDGAVISNFFSISTEGLLHDITSIDIDKGSGLSSDVIRWTKTDQVFSWLLTQRGALDNNMQLLYDDGAVVTTYLEADRAGNINIPVGTLTGQSIVQKSGTIGTDNFASQLTGWRGTYAGDWDVRSLFTDELRAKAFTADITQALAGSDFLTKSVAILDADFTVPWGQKIVAVDTTNKIFEVAGNHTANVAVSNTLFVRESTGNDATYTVSAVTFNGTSGNTEITVNEVISSATADGYIGKQGTLSVEDLPGQDDIAVFTASDWIRLRIFDRSGGGLTIGDAWGLVTGYVDQADGTQDWTFTCLDSGFVAGLDIFKGSIILDYGQSGDGYIERTVLDDQGSPYSQVVTWTGNPIDNQTVKTRTGILDGIQNASGAGFYGENTFLTESLLAGDLTKVSNYLEFASGVLTVNAEAFDLSATNILIDSAADRAKFGDATNFIDWNAGALSIASTVFDLNAGTLILENTTPKLAMGASASTLGISSASDTGTYLNGIGHVRIGTTDASGNLSKGFKFDGTNALLEAGNASIGINSGFFGASDILAYSLNSVTLAAFEANNQYLTNGQTFIGENLSQFVLNGSGRLLVGDFGTLGTDPHIFMAGTVGSSAFSVTNNSVSANTSSGPGVFKIDLTGAESHFIGGTFFDANDLWLGSATKANATVLLDGVNGKIVTKTMGQNIYVRSSFAAFGRNNIASSISNDDYSSHAAGVGTTSDTTDQIKGIIKYFHRFGISKIRILLFAKRTNTIASGLWTFENDITLSISTETQSQVINTAGFTEYDFTLDISNLVVDTFYDLEINVRAFLDGDAGNVGSDNAEAETFLREDIQLTTET